MLAQASPAVNTVLAILFIINCVVMIVFVLFRQSDSGGIGAAFGGGEGGGAFGTKGQAVVDKVLTFMGATFIVLALVFNLVSTAGGRTDTTGIEGSDTPADGGE